MKNTLHSRERLWLTLQMTNIFLTVTKSFIYVLTFFLCIQIWALEDIKWKSLAGSFDFLHKK